MVYIHKLVKRSCSFTKGLVLFYFIHITWNYLSDLSSKALYHGINHMGVGLGQETWLRFIYVKRIMVIVFIE